MAAGVFLVPTGGPAGAITFSVSDKEDGEYVPLMESDGSTAVGCTLAAATGTTVPEQVFMGGFFVKAVFGAAPGAVTIPLAVSA